MSKVLIVTGGSGGHVIPALTIYDHIKSNLDVKIATDQRGTKFFNTKKYKYVLINVPNIFDNFYLLPLNVLRFFLSVIKSYFFLKKEKVTKIVSTGGYMSFPFCLASVLLNCELILFEPNSVLGRSNKYMIKIARKILCYDKNLRSFPNKYSKKIIEISPIIRKEIYDLNQNLKNNNENIKILIVGGSQGASFFNEKITNMILELSKEKKVEIIQQVNSSDEKNKIEELYKKSNIIFELFNFDESLYTKIKSVDLAITRSGASTIAELAQLNIPFLAIPFPFAKDDHQFYNAKFYEIKNCCWLIRQNHLTKEIFINLIKDKTDHREKKINLQKFTNQNTWNDVNKKLLHLINEN